MATETLKEKREIRRASRPLSLALTTFPRPKSRSEFRANETASSPDSDEKSGAKKKGDLKEEEEDNVIGHQGTVTLCDTRASKPLEKLCLCPSQQNPAPTLLA